MCSEVERECLGETFFRGDYLKFRLIELYYPAVGINVEHPVPKNAQFIIDGHLLNRASLEGEEEER